MFYIKYISVKIDQLLDQSTSEGRKKKKKLNVTQRFQVEQYISLDKIINIFTSGYKIC